MRRKVNLPKNKKGHLFLLFMENFFLAKLNFLFYVKVCKIDKRFSKVYINSQFFTLKMIDSPNFLIVFVSEKYFQF